MLRTGLHQEESGGAGEKVKRVIQAIAFAVSAAMLCCGCGVEGKPGQGTKATIQESQTGRKGYYYLPAGYDPDKSWPVVLTFHAYVPFGGAERQIREWESTADEYGLIVVSPVLVNSGPRMEPGMYRVTDSVKRDTQAAMGMLDYVLEHTSADRDRVLVTGLSSGGALMHYVANQYPERFAALCSRCCFFNPAILSEEKARQMAGKKFPVMIYYAEYDAIWVKLDSQKAVRWYEKMGFEVESFVIPQTLRPPGLALGHVVGAMPELAAEFFLRTVPDTQASK